MIRATSPNLENLSSLERIIEFINGILAGGLDLTPEQIATNGLQYCEMGAVRTLSQ